MIKIKKIPLSMLQKLETKSLVIEVITMLAKHNLEALHLHDLYTLLQEQKTKMKHLTVPYGKHSLTKELARLHEKRMRIASYIAMQVSEMEKMDGEEKQKMAKTAKRCSKQFLIYLGRKSRAEVSFSLLAFFSSIRIIEHYEVQEAFIGMGLQTNLEDLEKTNNEYRQLYKRRKFDIDDRPKTGDILIEREAQSLLLHLFWKINYYQKNYIEIDYSPLIDELNVELTRCSKVIKTRIATNKRRARKKAFALEADKAAKFAADLEKSKADEGIVKRTNDAPIAPASKEIKHENNPLRDLKDGKKKDDSEEE